MDSVGDLVCRYQDARSLAELEDLAEKIIEGVGPDLSRFIRSQFPFNSANRDRWEDAFQETLIGIVAGLPCAPSHNFLGWCFGIAGHKISDQFRGRKTAVNTVVDPELLRDALEDARTNESFSAADQAALEEAIELIKQSHPPCVVYLWERYVVGLSFELLGVKYGITEDAATKRVHRCLKLAQQLVKDKARHG